MTRFDVFLSYRRKGGFETAKHLFDLLTKDGYKVCLDLDTLREGDFNKALLKRIDDCQDFILIVDAHAFDRSIDPDYDPKKDWLRQELAYALMRGKNVIPILLAGAAFPDNLPPDISQIAYKNGPSYSFEYFDSFYDKLKKFLHTKRASERKIWLFSILGLLLLVGAILYFIFSGKSVDAPKKPAETPVVVPQNTPVSQPEIASQPVTVQEQEPTPVNKEVDEPVVNVATAPQTVGSDKTTTVSKPVEKKGSPAKLRVRLSKDFA